MRIGIFIYYSVLVSSSVIFCSQPANTAPQINNEFQKLNTLRMELRDNCQVMVNLGQALQPDSSIAIALELQAICQSQEQRLKNFKSQLIICRQTGKLSVESDQTLKQLIDTLSPVIEQAAQHATTHLQLKQESVNEQIRHDIIQKGTQLIAECDKISASTAICANLNSVALVNGCTPLAATTISMCALNLAERGQVLEAKAAIFTSQADNFLYKPTLSELQSNNSKQTENK